MIIVYTGDGKGKTCACVGQALRAMGQGMTVAFAQFMKRDGRAGEQRRLQALLGEHFLAGGKGFLRHEKDRHIHRAAALHVLAWAKEQLADADMLILDEALYALGCGILTRDEVEELFSVSRETGRHIVLSGRDAPEWLVDAADMVTSMNEVKHPWQKGVKAAPGIEY